MLKWLSNLEWYPIASLVLTILTGFGGLIINLIDVRDKRKNILGWPVKTIKVLMAYFFVLVVICSAIILLAHESMQRADQIRESEIKDSLRQEDLMRNQYELDTMLAAINATLNAQKTTIDSINVVLIKQENELITQGLILGYQGEIIDTQSYILRKQEQTLSGNNKIIEQQNFQLDNLTTVLSNTDPVGGSTITLSWTHDLSQSELDGLLYHLKGKGASPDTSMGYSMSINDTLCETLLKIYGMAIYFPITNVDSIFRLSGIPEIEATIADILKHTTESAYYTFSQYDIWSLSISANNNCSPLDEIFIDVVGLFEHKINGTYVRPTYYNQWLEKSTAFRELGNRPCVIVINHSEDVNFDQIEINSRDQHKSITLKLSNTRILNYTDGHDWYESVFITKAGPFSQF